MIKILRNDQGETLIEVLASILIATLSVALLFTCVMASSRMEQDAESVDEKHYSALSEADAQITPTPDPSAVPPVRDGTVSIERIDSTGSVEATASPTPSIEVYGDEGMFSYRRQP